MPKRTPRPGYTFPGVVPKEAIAFIENKGWQVGFSYLDVFREEHAFSFTVAKAMQLDVLEAIRTEVEAAIKQGRTLEQFRKDLTPTLQRLGWWGEQKVEDPASGKVKTARLGSPRRLKTIYDANLRAARSAGQWERIQRTKEDLPYLHYGLGPSEHHREEHASWDGTVLPADDPWFDTHFTPNGWGCKCRIRQISAYEMQKKGWSVSARPDNGTREWINKRTGEVMQVPVGIDPGWDYNPGKERRANLDRFMAGKLKGVNPELAEVARKDLEAYAKQ